MNKKPNPIGSFFTTRWRTLRTWVAAHKKASLGLAALFLLIGATIGYALFFDTPSEPAPEPPVPKKLVKKPETKKFYSPLTGLKLPNEAATKKPITAIMIENSPDARPQSGMQEAEVTYEAIAEGGITRFLNLYQQNKPGLIGPVRSLRPYFVDWLAPWNASVVHVGGSKRALDEVRNGSYRDVDQFFNPGSYWRSSDRYAPHNVYTNFKRLDALNKRKKYTQSEPQPLVHDDVKKPKKPTATKINVTMSSPTYDSAWSYHAKSNSYHRQQGGAPHKDREAGQITAHVVIILKMQMDIVMEDGQRAKYHSSGSGEAVVFQNGTVSSVKWNKPATNKQISFTTKDGKPFALARGKVWMSAVPVNNRGNVSWQ